MSKYLGDFSASSVIDFKFTTFRPSTGAPFTLAGTPAVSVYKDNDITQSTAGVTLTVDFDGVTGLHHVRITTASDATFYANGGEFECVITTGTVDAVSVVGSCVGRFTLRSQASLYPTTAGNTLDVNANGEAGVDWANVGGQTSTVGLSNTTISTTQQITSVSGSVGSVSDPASIWNRLTSNLTTVGSVGKLLVDNVNATISSRSTLTAADVWNALTSGFVTVGSIGKLLADNINATISSRMATYTQPTGFLSASFPTTVASPTNITSGTITTVSGNVNGSVNSVTSAVTVGTINADAINAAAIATDAIDADAIASGAITIRLDTDGTASEARLVTGTVASDVWNALVASYVTANTFGARIVRTRSTSPSNEVTITGAFHIAADVHELQPAVIEDIHFADSALVIGSAAGTGVKAYLNTAADEGIADTLLNRNIAGGGNGTGGTLDRTVRSALRALRNRSGISGSTLTVYTEDDTATAWTASVSTTAGANPVTGIDPTGP